MRIQLISNLSLACSVSFLQADCLVETQLREVTLEATISHSDTAVTACKTKKERESVWMIEMSGESWKVSAFNCGKEEGWRLSPREGPALA